MWFTTPDLHYLITILAGLFVFVFYISKHVFVKNTPLHLDCICAFVDGFVSFVFVQLTEMNHQWASLNGDL